MAYKRQYDLVVKIGTYKNSAGEEKSKMLNIGTLMRNEENKQFILLDPLINIGAIPRDGDRLLVSMFVVKDKSSAQQTATPAATTNPSDIAWEE